LNATAKWLLRSASLGLALSASWAAAAPPALAPSWALLATGAGSDAEFEKGYLSQARDAMKGGRFDDAEGFLQKAEALNIKHDNITGRFSDSPAKVRADLSKARGQAPRSPSSQFQAWPPSVNKTAPAMGNAPRDPFAARANDNTIDRLTDDSKSKATRYLETARNCLRNGDVAGAVAFHQKARAENATFERNEYSPDALAAEMQAAGVDPSRLTGAAAPRFNTQAMPEGDRDLASRIPAYETNRPEAAGGMVTNPDQLAPETNQLSRGASQVVHNTTIPNKSSLVDARKALSFGDVRRASDFANQARQLGVDSRSGDSPAAIEALIAKSNRLTAGPQKGMEAQFAREYAEFLMEQSEGLLEYREFKDAERLAQHAKSLKVRYGAGERNPDQLLEYIAGLQQQAPRHIENRFATPANGNVRRLPTVGEEPAALTPKQQAIELMGDARAALERGDVETAHRLAEAANKLNVPNSEFASGEKRPWEFVLETARALNRRGGVVQAGNVENATHNERGGYAVERGVYNPNTDRSRNVAAQATEPGQFAAPPRARPVWDGDPNTAGPQYFEAGMKAFTSGDREAALQHFKQAWKYNNQLQPNDKAQLKDKLIALEAPRPDRLPEGQSSPLTQLDQKTDLLRQKLYKEITAEETAVEKMMKNEPDAALQRMKQMRERVATSELDGPSRKQLLSLCDRRIGAIEQYLNSNRADIDLANANRAVRVGLAQEQEVLIETQTKLAELVEQFNRLMEEQRYHEAEVIAKQAREIAPNEPVVQNLIWKAEFVTNLQSQLSIEERKRAGLIGQLESVDASSEGFDDRNPIRFNEKEWSGLTRRRRSQLEEARRKRSPVEMEIYRSLSKQVEVNFNQRPLAEVMDTLGKMANVNIHLDPQGLHAEGVDSNTPVSLNLATPISLKSALDLVLQQLRLSYVVQHEVLMITSQQTRDANLVSVVYNVGDLVIPIPNFTPSNNMGLTSALRDAHQIIGNGGGGSFGPGGVGMSFASNSPTNSTSPLAVNPTAMAQMGLPTGSMASSRPDQFMSGPGSLGGAAAADFDSLIDLITSTVHPETWKEGGTGEGTIAPFPTNLSIVVSQTEEVHQAISDLLDQLRRLQDLQVTIEVRFITLNDNFFERIGVDFDFNIDDNSAAFTPLPDDVGPSIVVGLDPQGQVTSNRDLQFTQNSFSTAIPQFGGFDPATAANFGFAILSDIEVFFLLQAATGDTRTNVLQAPKVTLFNGQQAVVSDTSQRPFVTSVIPVVGDFAVGHQPVITVLSEGTSLSVQAVVSADRRFVRLTLVPFFSQIGDVEEFTFNGRTTTNTGTSTIDPTDPRRLIDNQAQTSTEGTTVQLPTFAFTTVTTTVSVPDGGTVLLGGIKRLSEGRSERGVPILSKVPYVSRLFKNVGIGRTTQSLMMMVTPRIIIQEEEEEKLGIDLGP
jgi:general secretion pathway protein D